jgi:hypothetical protein
MTVKELADVTSSDDNAIRCSLDILVDRGMVKRGLTADRYPKQRFEVVA